MIINTIDPKIPCNSYGGMERVIIDGYDMELLLESSEYRIVSTNEYSYGLTKLYFHSGRVLNDDFHNVHQVNIISCIGSNDKVLVLLKPKSKVLYQSGKNNTDFSGAIVSYYSNEYILYSSYKEYIRDEKIKELLK